MSARSNSDRPDGGDSSWASESLPMAVRKELLERELKKLGFRKADGQGPAAQQQQQAQHESSSHPQADGGGESHGD